MKPFLLLTALLILFSCTKFGKNVSIKGHVKNPFTNEPQKNVEVKLFSLEGVKTNNLKVVKTDNNGYYEINKLNLGSKLLILRVGSQTDYTVGWTEDNGITYTKSVDYTNIKRGHKKTIDFHAVRTAQFYFNLLNVNCSGPTDTLIYQYIPKYGEPGIIATKTGCNSYFGLAFIPEGPLTFNYTVIRNGISTDHTTTFIATADSPSPSLVIEY